MTAMTSTPLMEIIMVMLCPGLLGGGIVACA